MRKEALLLSVLLVCACSLGAIAVVPPVTSGEPPCKDTVRAEVLANDINVYHDQAQWNCCATITFDLDAHADTFDLYESEAFEIGPCHCLCCFDLATTITDVAPGEYLVRVLAAESGELFGEVWVQVPEVWSEAEVMGPVPQARSAEDVWPGAPGIRECAAGLGGTLQSPCGGWTTSVKETPSTWGQIKAIFR